MLKSVYPGFQNKAEKADEDARAWVNLFILLGDKLSIRVQ
jgi:hypothetical protein